MFSISKSNKNKVTRNNKKLIFYSILTFLFLNRFRKNIYTSIKSNFFKKKENFDEDELSQNNFNSQKFHINAILMCFIILIMKFTLGLYPGKDGLPQPILQFDYPGKTKKIITYSFFVLLILTNLFLLFFSQKKQNLIYFIINIILIYVIIIYVIIHRKSFIGHYNLYFITMCIVLLIILYLSGLMTFGNKISHQKEEDNNVAPIKKKVSHILTGIIMSILIILILFDRNGKMQMLLRHSRTTAFLIFSIGVTISVINFTLSNDMNHKTDTKGNTTLVPLIVSIFSTLFYLNPYSYRNNVNGIQHKYRKPSDDYIFFLNFPNMIFALIAYVISLYTGTTNTIPLFITNLLNSLIRFGLILFRTNYLLDINKNHLNDISTVSKSSNHHEKHKKVLSANIILEEYNHKYNIITTIITSIISIIGIFMTYIKHKNIHKIFNLH